jgi:hypothetical protein
MCGFVASLLDFEKLTEKQKKALLEGLRQRKHALQLQLAGVNESLKGINDALKVVEKKVKK